MVDWNSIWIHNAIDPTEKIEWKKGKKDIEVVKLKLRKFF